MQSSAAASTPSNFELEDPTLRYADLNLVVLNVAPCGHVPPRTRCVPKPCKRIGFQQFGNDHLQNAEGASVALTESRRIQARVVLSR